MTFKPKTIKYKINNLLKCLLLYIVLLFFSYFNSEAQIVDISTIPTSSLDKDLKSAINSPLLKIQSVIGIKNYPRLLEYRGEHIFSIADSIYGKIPFKMYIPENYQPSQPLPLILLLHGGIGQSKFSDALRADKSSEMESDPFYTLLCKQGFIVVMPYADPEKGFDWAANQLRTNRNFTFTSLTKLLSEIKRSVNVDDNKVFAFGHSDGSDGVFALDVYQPSLFAGFVGYNSMLKVLFTNNFYLRNTTNRSLYLVHSDKDDLRPIQQTKAIVEILDSLKVPLNYKEYKGYKHFDAHLALDFMNSIDFINATVRNPYPKTVYWETNDHLYERCDWLLIKEWNLDLPAASWHKVQNVLTYNKLNKTWLNLPYYKLAPSAAITGSYHDNVFYISTSRVTRFQVLISREMVDLKKSISIYVNGKQVFTGMVKQDNAFCMQQFLATHDKKATWISAITLNITN